jgi:hypothetical protein
MNRKKTNTQSKQTSDHKSDHTKATLQRKRCSSACVVALQRIAQVIHSTGTNQAAGKSNAVNDKRLDVRITCEP